MTQSCAEATRLAGEPLAGTAAHVETWILVAESRPWTAEGWKTQAVDAELRAAVTAWCEWLPRPRVQLVRRRNADATPAGRVEVVRAVPGDCARASWAPGAGVPLSTWDPAAELRAWSEADVPVVLVCTHGKRDACCARLGLPVFDRLSADARLDVWQTTHLGGHRFAPTLVGLPSGVSLGHLNTNVLGPVAEALVSGRGFPVPHLRGVAAWPAPAQVAAAELCRAEQDVDLSALRLRDCSERRSGCWRVRFVDAAGAAIAEAEVLAEDLPGERPKSCGEPPVPIARLSARLTS